MIGRLRNLRPRLSRNEAPVVAVDGAEVLELMARDSMYALSDRDKALRQVDAFAVEVDELKGRLAEVEAERGAMAKSLIVLARSRNELRRLLAASPEQAHRNCLELSDRLAEVCGERDVLERRVFELEGRAAKPKVLAADGGS